ncbi:MAG: hypothetical protein WAQ29_11460 [Nitrososphaeraceae archaeon]
MPEIKKACFPLLIFFLMLTTGIIFLNFSMNTTFLRFEDDLFVTTIYAQSDLSSLSPEEFRQQAKDFVSTLMELRNRTNSNQDGTALRNIGLEIKV